MMTVLMLRMIIGLRIYLRMKVMAIDFGTKRIGLAFTDPTLSFVSKTLTLKVKSEKDAAQKAAEFVFSEDIHKIILGYPLNDDGTKSEMTLKVEDFKVRLEKLVDVEIEYSDERYTSEEAEKYLHQMGKSIKGNKNRIDAISAALILNDYLRDQRE
ncbi:MAG: Holliday junction resolvase RuvX [candidate division Zixibacteria bacterium]|nr:Holliday junction resolvase RuvX [candidate division Zixibacteria bacterium]NIR63477.1 Holliday junction resolvase RuvX [candidate division Zixibacteria bacterium]NIS17720.1 Holliday junction resolvase RuvX [candidate division Zixibacteria bacterium]NIS45432.1 Holliday junction resolvase RuvX [candidate division Zixibacteria bacterium]NIT54036.1 Holliday junction resolvase RuvX [candidate division Zixibacteria bacterium]